MIVSSASNHIPKEPNCGTNTCANQRVRRAGRTNSTRINREMNPSAPLVKQAPLPRTRTPIMHSGSAYLCLVSLSARLETNLSCYSHHTRQGKRNAKTARHSTISARWQQARQACTPLRGADGDPSGSGCSVIGSPSTSTKSEICFRTELSSSSSSTD